MEKLSPWACSVGHTNLDRVAGTSKFQLLELHLGEPNDTDSPWPMAVADDMWPSRRFYMTQVLIQIKAEIFLTKDIRKKTIKTTSAIGKGPELCWGRKCQWLCGSWIRMSWSLILRIQPPSLTCLGFADASCLVVNSPGASGKWICWLCRLQVRRASKLLALWIHWLPLQKAGCQASVGSIP